MSEPFKILADFLDQFEPQVSGRSTEPAPAEMRQKLELFAKGDLAPEERGEICAMLAQRPEWVEILVREVKKLRQQR